MNRKEYTDFVIANWVDYFFNPRYCTNSINNLIKIFNQLSFDCELLVDSFLGKVIKLWLKPATLFVGYTLEYLSISKSLPTFGNLDPKYENLLIEQIEELVYIRKIVYRAVESNPSWKTSGIVEPYWIDAVDFIFDSSTLPIP